MCLAIAHREGEAVHIDCVREIPSPFNPAAAVSELVAVLRQYRCGTVRGDRYASQWVVAEFEKHNVSYRHSPLPKSSLYVELLPRLNAKSVVLLDHERTINQLCNLERRVSRAGQDSIDHPKGAAHHDDCINACAGAAYCASGKYDEPGLLWGRYGTPDPQPRDLSHHNGPCVIVGADGSRNVGWATVKVQ
jgi:hypothetical protein